MTYDLIYSIIAHESPEVLTNMIENITKYNNNNSFLIILHLNEFMYNEFKSIDNKVIINPIYYDKNKHHHILTQAHLENFNYMKQHYKFNNFMLLASNCMFIKQIEHIKQKKNSNNIYTINEKTDIHKLRKEWRFFVQFSYNKQIVDIFQNNRIKILHESHEGATYNFHLMNRIYNFIYDNKIFDLVEKEMCFEEVLFPSLERYFNGKLVNRYCKVYLYQHNSTPTIEDIIKLLNKDGIQCIVKRVKRNMQHRIRQFINKLDENNIPKLIKPKNSIIITNQHIQYDIVYSIINNTHNLEILIQNIKKFNKNNKFLICIHNNQQTNNLDDNNVIINKIKYEKHKLTHSILKAHIENYTYIKSLGYKFNNIMLLPSNAMFVKQIKSFKKTRDKNTRFTLIKGQNSILFNKNLKILNIFKNRKIKIEYISCEGAVYSDNLMNKIVKFINNNHIFDEIEFEMSFENVLLPSLENYFNNKLVQRYYKFYEYEYSDIPTMDDLLNLIHNNSHECIINRITTSLLLT